MGLSISRERNRILKSPSAGYGRLRLHDSPQISRAARSLPNIAGMKRSASVGSKPFFSHERSPIITPALGSSIKNVSENRVLVDGGTEEQMIFWIGPALLCALAYAFYNVFIKRGSDSIHPILGGVIIQLIAFFSGIFLLVTIGFKEGLEEINYNKEGIQWSILAGVSVGIAEMLSFFVMGMGVQASQAIPVIIGGSVLFGTLLGTIMLDEILTFQGWCGVFFLVLGISLVATDPGEALNQN